MYEPHPIPEVRVRARHVRHGYCARDGQRQYGKLPRTYIQRHAVHRVKLADRQDLEGDGGAGAAIGGGAGQHVHRAATAVEEVAEEK